MIMSMVNIRLVRVRMLQRVVGVVVHVIKTPGQIRMSMFVVPVVMRMAMRVQQSFMEMSVLVTSGEHDRQTHGHNYGCDNLGILYRLAKQAP